MASNIEIKLKVEDLDAVERLALQHGARNVGLLVQRDTFYRCASGRLKLREIENDHSELIAYSRSDEAAARSSDYSLFAVHDPVALHTALARSLGVTGVVAKRRMLLLWRNVRIHLDRVDSLGKFIELESVVGEIDAKSAAENLHELLRLLDLESAEIVPVAYVDLLIGRDK